MDAIIQWGLGLMVAIAVLVILAGIANSYIGGVPDMVSQILGGISG